MLVCACGANSIPGQFCFFIHWLLWTFHLFPVLDDSTAIFGSIQRILIPLRHSVTASQVITLKLTALKLGLRVSRLLHRARGAPPLRLKVVRWRSTGFNCRVGNSRAFKKISTFWLCRNLTAVLLPCNIDAVDVNVVRYVHSTHAYSIILWSVPVPI
jgi:hypothetical protein